LTLSTRVAAVSVRPKTVAITAAIKFAGSVHSESVSAIRWPRSRPVNSAVLVAMLMPMLPKVSRMANPSPGAPNLAALDEPQLHERTLIDHNERPLMLIKAIEWR
jgi:hypothetical protein